MKRKFLQKRMHKLWFGIQVIKTYKTWVIGFMDYFKLLKEKIIIHKLRKGHIYAVRTNTEDFGIINEVFIVKEYHKLLRFIKNNSVIIDIGAQIGVFSIFAAKKNKNVKIYSYEPFEKNFNLLKRNISLNNLDNIYVFKQGIAGEKGRKELFISEENTGGHSFYAKGNKKVIIETITLKDVFEKNKIGACDFLKIDCEGAEYEILYNTPLKYLEKIKSITLEYHKNGNVDELQRFLEKARFNIEIDRVGEILYAWR